MGLDAPGPGSLSVQRRLSFVHSMGKSVSLQMPPPVGPGKPGQSAASSSADEKIRALARTQKVSRDAPNERGQLVPFLVPKLCLGTLRAKLCLADDPLAPLFPLAAAPHPP